MPVKFLRSASIDRYISEAIHQSISIYLSMNTKYLNRANEKSEFHSLSSRSRERKQIQLSEMSLQPARPPGTRRPARGTRHAAPGTRHPARGAHSPPSLPVDAQQVVASCSNNETCVHLRGLSSVVTDLFVDQLTRTSDNKPTNKKAREIGVYG